MKKVLLWVTAFTLGLASCQKSEVVDDVNAGSNELNFGVYQGKQTRAGELMNDDLEVDGVKFPLHAYKGKQAGAKTLYFNDTLTYEGTRPNGKWKTSIPRFLPEGDQFPLQFYAYYAYNKSAGKEVPEGITYIPIQENDLSKADAYPTLEYAIQKNGITGTNPSGADVDLVAATVNDNVGTSITIPFKHILSQINFGVKGYYGAKIQIKNIVIHQVFNDGTFSFNPDPLVWGWVRSTTTPITLFDYNYTFPAFTTPGATGNTGAWTNTNKEEEIRYIFGDGGNWGPGKIDNIWYITGDGTSIQGSTIDLVPETPTAKLSNSLMLMPQKLTAGTKKAYVTFKYNIRDLDNNYVIGGPQEGNMVDGQFDLNMGNTTNAYADTWKPNLRYLYIIDFTGYLDGQKLTFDVDVETNPWENYNPDDGNDGIVLLSSTGQPMFKDVKEQITSTTSSDAKNNYTIKGGHVFSNIKWDWSYYTMKDKVFTAAGQTFTVDFSKVIFNGNTITVTAPIGFTITNGVASETNQTLTFTSIVAATVPNATGAIKNATITAASGIVYGADATWNIASPNPALDAEEYFIIDASAVWLNGWKLIVNAPTDYTLSGKYPKYKITKDAPPVP